jgi:hypothetical protein
MKEKTTRVATFNVDKEKWERFKKVARINNSDPSKELRKFIDDYLSKNSQLMLFGD